jgi:hypothetical protein
MAAAPVIVCRVRYRALFAVSPAAKPPAISASASRYP